MASTRPDPIPAIIAPCCSRSTSATPRPTSAPSEGAELAEHWRFRTVAGATGDEIAERIAGLLALSGIERDEIEALCVSSVVPPLGGQYEAMAERYFDAPCLLVGPGVKTGMPIRIDNPYEVGADRLVNAVAAYERIGGACIVVDFGTGINFDVGLGRRRVPRRRDRARGRDLAHGARPSAARGSRGSSSPSPRRRSASPPAARSSPA